MSLVLNLGCGKAIRPDSVNVDSVPVPGVDQVVDLESFPWPWPDEHFGQVLMQDVIEHLSDPVGTLYECWRVLKVDGLLFIRTPHYTSPNAWINPEHKRPYHEESFDFFDPMRRWGREYPLYRDRPWDVLGVTVADGNVNAILRKVVL